MRRYCFVVILLLFAIVTSTLAGDTVDKRQYADHQREAGEKSYAARQLSEAMNHYLAGLRVSEKNNFYEESCKIYIGIGNLYSSQADYEMGLRFYRKALAIAERQKILTLQNKALNNLVGASCFAGKPDEGRRYYDKLAANKETTAEYGYNLLMCQGIIAANEGNTRKAIDSYRQAISYAHSHSLDGGHTESAQSCLAQLYHETHHADSALYFLKKNEAKARTTRQADLLVETLRSLAAIYKETGDRQRALVCQEEYVRLADSLYSKEEFYNMKNAQFLYDAHKSETAINSLTAEKEHREHMIAMQRRWLLTLAIGAMVFAAMLFWVYRQKRQLKQAYNELFDRNQALINENAKTASPEAQALLTDSQREALLGDIRRVMEQTDEFCQTDFTIDKLANLVESNSRYVSAAINDGYGKNFRTFLNEYRIKEAMKRLSDSQRYGNYTIKAVSESVGYKSQANFISVFTKVTGMKPSIYQKISQERNQTTI